MILQYTTVPNVWALICVWNQRRAKKKQGSNYELLKMTNA